ncbi:TRAP transporter large permease subunit [Bradyrhizobium jicamae]|uniref:TRAP transporter large permease subunit n=2 Tax=Bradyrhizobium jicamae TaxID=280332 RepID=A0ABS5FU68_9BRAD|nr:TRAP transporter large permease subunit [Bradyrhizobium jicamae]
MVAAAETRSSPMQSEAPIAARAGVLRRLDRALGTVIAVPTAALVLVEVFVLLGGVTSRYVFHHPIIWSDELASTLFLWLAMLGSAIALHRSEHMRMTAFVGTLPPAVRLTLEVVAMVGGLTFLLLILPSSWNFAAEEIPVTTPAMQISDAWRAAALPAGFAIMIAVCAIRLLALGNWRHVGGALLASTVVVGGLYLLQPTFENLGNLNLLIFFVGGVACLVFAGVPIAFAFGLSTFAYQALTTDTPIVVVVGRIEEGISNLILLSVPLFVFLGLLIEMTGMARAMVNFLASLLAHVRGGLSYVLIGAMYLVSGISGSKAADMAAIAPALFPEMKARGSKPGELVALLAATGAQTETIPPSLVLITIGSVTGISIASLFTGGLLPGVVVGAILCVVVWRRNRREDLSHVAKAPAREIARTFVVALPAIALPFVIRAAVIEGVATATEVSTIGIAYSVLAGLLIYRKFDWRRIYPMLVETAALSGAILLIIGAATAMAWSLTQSGFSRDLASAMAGLPGGTPTFLLVSIAAFVVLGSVLEGIPAVVLFGPLLFPIAKQVGVHEVHYAMVIILAMGVGLFAPPFGVGYYAACAISKVHPDEGLKPIAGYIVALLIGLLLVAFVPWISIGFL